MAKNELKLKVAEAIQDDVNKGIVRIDANLMRQLNIKSGDYVEVEGERLTVAIAGKSYPSDIGLNLIRMDGLIRRNAKTGIGEIIKVRKAQLAEAKRIIVCPAQKGLVVRADPENFKHGLLGRAVVKGDVLALGGTKKRRNMMSSSPLFDDIFRMMEEDMFGSKSFGFGLNALKFLVVETNPKGKPVIITDATEAVLNPEAIEVIEDSAPEVTYEDIGGLEEEVRKIREMVELPIKRPDLFQKLGIEAPKGVLLHGPPGTGKTLLAKAVANETNSHFIVLNGPQIMSKYYGESEQNLRKIFEEAEKNAPSIIFIDELDAIAPRREESKGEVERRVVAQLLALMDGLKSRGKVVVIAATNIPDLLDPALRRPGRFDREIEIGVPNKEGRLIILKIHTRNMPLAKDVKLDELANITYGYVGADLAALTKEAAMIVLRRILPDIPEESKTIPKEVLDKLQITHDDFRDALKVVRPSAMREVMIDIPDLRWDSIGGLEDVKQEIKEAVEWPLNHPQAFKNIGIEPPKGILLYGPPGTGKTMLAKAVANESKANFILVKGPELLSKWVGESEKGVRNIFKKARQTAPTIIFFDEIDSLFPKRGMSTESHVTERVVNQFLTEIDGIEELHDVVIVGATNRPDMLDPALLRPGRFDRVILTSPPNEKARLDILKVHTAKMKLSKNVILTKLAHDTNGFVGADIQALCKEAGMLALREDIKSKEVSMNHFKEALKRVGPSVSAEIVKLYKQFNDTYRKQRAKEMANNDKPAYFG